MIPAQDIDDEKFGKNLLKILTKHTPKRNLLVLKGCPNSGKSTIVRTLLELYPTYGEIVNSSAFMYQDLLYKPVGIWEEPIISDQQSEKCKLLFEGKDTVIDIKFKPPTILKRTPILITTNHDLWHWDINAKHAFLKRGLYYYFYRELEFKQQAECTLSSGEYGTNLDEDTTDYDFDFDKQETTITIDSDCRKHSNTRIGGHDNPATKKMKTTNIESPGTSKAEGFRRALFTSPANTKTIKEKNTLGLVYPHGCDWILFLRLFINNYDLERNIDSD